jgi:ABC-type sugar transport system ATPase subunit
MAADYILEMRDMTKTIPGVRAFDGVNLNIRPGMVPVICGESGAHRGDMV